MFQKIVQSGDKIIKISIIKKISEPTKICLPTLFSSKLDGVATLIKYTPPTSFTILSKEEKSDM